MSSLLFLTVLHSLCSSLPNVLNWFRNDLIQILQCWFKWHHFSPINRCSLLLMKQGNVSVQLTFTSPDLHCRSVCFMRERAASLKSTWTNFTRVELEAITTQFQLRTKGRCRRVYVTRATDSKVKYGTMDTTHGPQTEQWSPPAGNKQNKVKVFLR